jgi:integrase
MAVGLCSGGLVVVVVVVARMLGHASAAMTLDVYVDLFDSDLDTVADRLDTLHREAAW